MQSLIPYIENGWPDASESLPIEVRPFITFREELSYCDGLIFKGEKIVVPAAEIQNLLLAIHSGHPGVTSSIRRARQFLYWFGQANDVKKFVEKCQICQRSQRSNPKETILEKETPELPFQIVATDLFTFGGKDYLLIADNYSGYFDFVQMHNTSSPAVIQQLKKWFSVHGIPEILESDNGPQYSARVFAQFASLWNFEHRTSSPFFPRSNGLAERFVQTAKELLVKCTRDNSDVYLALLHARNTPRNEVLKSTNERLLSRLTRTNLPCAKSYLSPKTVTNVPQELHRLRRSQHRYHDRSAQKSPDLSIGDRVRVQMGKRDWKFAEVIDTAGAPRSSIIRTTDGEVYRRNKHHLRKTISNYR